MNRGSANRALKVVSDWLDFLPGHENIVLGLPEFDDRVGWRVGLTHRHDLSRTGYLGEFTLYPDTFEINDEKTTKTHIIRERMDAVVGNPVGKHQRKYRLSNLESDVVCGDSEHVLRNLPQDSVDLVFTSPPYYNAKIDYSEYVSYSDYLKKMGDILGLCHTVLGEGRFIVVNVSPVLVRRMNRNESSHRIPVHAHFHQLLYDAGFDFIDDIVWEKPEGAGWATNRGRRFAADRNPLQYKTVPVTESLIVYRKRTDLLIDWHIRNHPKDLVQQSKIGDDYEKTNIWRIGPAHDKRHPAIFPDELVEKVIKYYSFVNDVVLDPFAGIGTTGRVARSLNRRFYLIEQNETYAEIARKECMGEDESEKEL